MQRSSRKSARGVSTLGIVLALATVALPRSVAAQAQGGDGFLFQPPRVTIEFETGYGFQRAGGELFDWMIQEHTLSRGDFNSIFIGGELGIRLDEQLDLVLGLGYQSSRTVSEYRFWVGTDDLPIEQTTEFRIIPAVAGVKYYLKPRGRAVGRFAWIPTKVVPWVGGGVGVMSYRFAQDGEFVDYDTSEIYNARPASAQSGFLFRPSAGVDLAAGGHFVLSGEARYHFASGSLNRSFQGFGDEIDLNGLQVVVGVGVRF